VTLSRKELLEQAHSILLMCLRTDEGWLLRKRLAQPMFGRIGFVHGEPIAEEPAIDTAKRCFEERTSLRADFKPIGTGYVCLFQGDDLDSFTHFTLLYADKYEGELLAQMRNGENSWMPTPDFEDPAMIPSMPDLIKLIEARGEGLFYADLRY
jgi:ADP-ribose pyrophosphatase YjhB (NUDIX family)